MDQLAQHRSSKTPILWHTSFKSIYEFILCLESLESMEIKMREKKQAVFQIYVNKMVRLLLNYVFQISGMQIWKRIYNF